MNPTHEILMYYHYTHLQFQSMLHFSKSPSLLENLNQAISYPEKEYIPSTMNHAVYMFNTCIKWKQMHLLY